jgi:hypothetical protein
MASQSQSLPAGNTWLVKAFCKALFPQLPFISLFLFDFMQSQLVFLFKQLRTPDGRVGGGGGRVKGRKDTSRVCG